MSSPRSELTAALHACSEDLLRYFLRRLDREDAADAVAEVMTIAWTRVDALPTASEETRMWLFGIAHNVRCTLKEDRSVAHGSRTAFGRR